MSATAVGSGSVLEGFALQAGRVNRAQAGAEQLTEETTALVEDLARRFGAGGTAPAPADTHDEILFYRALTDAQSAVMRQDRRAVRIALQRVQDALAQLVANAPVRDGRDANDVARWLTDVLSDVSQQRVADILGVTRRTLSRWSAEEAATRPADEDARRLRTVARTVNLLLRGLTAAGTVAWFELPNRELEGRTPAQELARADAAPRLERAAYALLGGDAS
jgi:transcriptional regulator with XRE-family HTH domain